MSAPERVEGEAPLRALAACFAQLPAELRVGGQAADRGGELVRVARLDEEPGLAVDDELRDTADLRADDRQACGHRLQHRDRHALGGAREDEDIGAGEQLGYVPSLTEEVDAVADPEPADLGLQLGSVRPLADDARIDGAWRERRETADERQEVLRRLQPADGDHDRPVPIAAGRRRGLDVNRVRDHRCALRGARARLETPCARVLGHADRHCRQGPHQSIGPVVEGRRRARVGRERPAVHGEDPNRYAHELGGQATEDPGLRTAHVEDVRLLAAQQADELDEAGEIPQRSDRAPNVSQRDEANAVRGRGFLNRAGAMRRNDDVEVADEGRKQLGDVGLSPTDLGESDQQQNARPARLGR